MQLDNINVNYIQLQVTQDKHHAIAYLLITLPYINQWSLSFKLISNIKSEWNQWWVTHAQDKHGPILADCALRWYGAT